MGPIQPITYKSSGSISNYFVEKYGFSKDCNIYSFTGDNLATILSLPLQPNDCLISLGTSTTVLLITENYQPSSQYHLFKHPTMPKHYMGMICYSNGALAREKARDEINKSTTSTITSPGINLMKFWTTVTSSMASWVSISPLVKLFHKRQHKQFVLS